MDYFVKNKRELNLTLSCLHANKNFNRKSCDKDVFFIYLQVIFYNKVYVHL